MKVELKRGSVDMDDENTFTVMGGDPSNPSWQEYLDEYTDTYKPHIEGIKKCIQENNILGETANRMANDHYFECEDGTIFCFSWRGWGDLMQAVVDKREGYMRYYM